MGAVLQVVYWDCFTDVIQPIKPGLEDQYSWDEIDLNSPSLDSTRRRQTRGC